MNLSAVERRRRQQQLQWLLLPLLLLFVQAVDGLFLHASSAVIRSWSKPTGGVGSGGARSLFGYRVATIRDDAGATYLLVSDPVGYHPDTEATSGTVHKCPISAADFNTSGPICADSALPFNFTNPDGDTGGFIEFAQFGASLASLPDGQFVVCAPGHNFVSRFNHTATPGLCAYWSSVSAQPQWLQKFFPHSANSKDERMFGNCLGGFQATLTSLEGGDTRLTVSGPFCMMQRLAVAVSSGTVFSNSTPVTYPNGFRNNYLGFSLASDPDSQTVYAASPSIQYDSQALLARIRSPPSAAADYVKVQIGRPFYDYLHRSFNYIGYASAVISASMVDKRKALVLGAPYQSEGTGPDGLDCGCVFVLPLEGPEGGPIDTIESVPVRYCGKEPGGRLGTSIVGIGDVNYDGSEDFAVGCPGCGANGTGAVYLFMGFANYANPPGPLEPFEIVLASDVSPLLAGLGWSLAVAADLDGNTVDELIAGAVTSRHAVVLPGRLLLDTRLSFRYADGGAGEDFQSEIPIHLFSRRLSWPVVATIDMRTKSGIDLTGYRFNLHVRLEEQADTELQRRFQIELLDCPAASANSDGWCQLSRTGPEPNAARFIVKFRLRALANNQRHAPPGAMLRDLKILVRWRMTDRALPPSSSSRGLFPAVLYGRRVFPGYEDAFEPLVYKFKTGVCDSNFGCNPTGNLRLRLVGESNVLLNSYHPVTVSLLVQKASDDPYYGGTALRLSPSPGVHVGDNVTLREISTGTSAGSAPSSHVRYWSGHKEVLLTEPFPDPPDVMTRDRRGQLKLTLRLNFDSKRVNYRVSFHLVNLLGDVAGFSDHVTRDRQPLDNWVSLEVNFNTSISLRLLSATDELMVADARASASESDLLSLTGATAASVIGPGLQHTYELLVATRPAAAVRGLTLFVRVPLVTSDGRLLLYFPKNAIASHTTTDAGRVSQYQPGVPFTSDDLEGFLENKDRDCLPLEADLAALLAKPDLTLLESQHEEVNATFVSERERRAVGDSTQPSPPPGSLATSGGLEAAAPSGAGNPGAESAGLPTFDCDRPDLAPTSFRCVTFRCTVRDLGRGGTLPIDRVFLHLHARLWSPTYFRRHLSRFNLRSTVTLSAPKDLAFRYSDLAGNSSVEQTFLFLGVRPPMVDRIPWGYIILAIFLGIWLLLLFILLLWYCNFFRRRQYDYDSVPQKETNDDDDFYR